MNSNFANLNAITQNPVFESFYFLQSQRDPAVQRRGLSDQFINICYAT